MGTILKDKLYSVVNSHTDVGEARYDITLNRYDEIYSVHFPGSPITPGACLIQIAKELACDYAGEDVRIKSIKNIKFVFPLIPTDTSFVTYSAEITDLGEEGMQWKINIHGGERLFAKMSLFFGRV